MINLCKKGFMSICSAKSCVEQETCTFHVKASNENRCMYFKFDEYCDNVNAQIDMKKSKETNELIETVF